MQNSAPVVRHNLIFSPTRPIFTSPSQQLHPASFNPWRPILWMILALFVIALALPCSVIAQAQNARVEGKVLDAQNAVVARAGIVLRNKLTGNVDTTSTANDGQYAFEQIVPGEYIITASSAGLSPQSFTVQVKVDSLIRVPDITLPIATVRENI